MNFCAVLFTLVSFSYAEDATGPMNPYIQGLRSLYDFGGDPVDANPYISAETSHNAFAVSAYYTAQERADDPYTREAKIHDPYSEPKGILYEPQFQGRANKNARITL